MEILNFTTECKENQPIKMNDYINHFKENKPIEGVLLVEFIDFYINKKSKRRTESFKNQYKTLSNHIKEFSKKYNAEIFTNSVTDDFLDDFIEYSENKNLKINTIKGLVDRIKNITKKAGTYGYAVDCSYDDVSMCEEESFSIYLSMNDISRIYYYNNLSKSQEKIKDLFIIGCLTALRYSDYSTLNISNFQDNYIVKTTQKSKTKVRIPMHDFVKEIIKKYDNNIPNGYCIQYFNKYIKMIMKKIGFNEEFTYTYTKGGGLITETKKKYELISSHTARRSGATNMYLTGRMRTFEIMSLTGHTSEKNFFKYIKVTKENIAKSISGDVFFRK